MAELVADASWVVAGTGLLLAVAVCASTGRLMVAIPVLLDMLLAAGLLRLGADAPWSSIATAATIVVLRKVVVAGIRESTVAAAAFSRSGRGSRRTTGQSRR
jgi:hypothetical protein